MLRADGVRGLVREHGYRGYLEIQAQMLGMDKRGRVPRVDGKAKFNESVTLPNGRKMPRKRPRDFSLPALWEGLIGPMSESLPGFGTSDQVGLIEIDQRYVEAISTGAFPSAVGQLIAVEVIEAYEMTEGFIGDQLVREFTSVHRDERIVGFTGAQGPKEVIEGEVYKDATFSEKFVGSRQTKRGRLISVTREAVQFDQTGQMLARAQGIGEAARQDRERRIVQGVIDHDSGVAIYAPSGTAEQLYSSGNNNLRTSAVLVDWTDIQETLDYHATNVTDDREPDDENVAQPLVWIPKILLTSVELAGVGAMVIQTGTSAALTSLAPNPLNLMLSTGIRALSSPFINTATTGDQWDDNSDWLFGDFQKQFRYKVIWPLQTSRAPAQNDEQFERDVLARFKVSEYGDIIAIDEKWVVKCDAA